MIVSELELTNFGPHQHLMLKNLGSIVGLMGDNGKGKSNILLALQFAFTSYLEDAANTYVYYFGEPEGASNGSVRAVFHQHGEQGEIFRQIGKTTKRKLTWKGAIYTSDEEVSQAMEEILGTDKVAATNAIFIKQYDLARLIYGTPGERQEVATKMMSIGYLLKRADLLYKKATDLSSSLQDYTVYQDELRASRLDAETRLYGAQEEQAATENMRPTILTWDAYRDAIRELRAAGDALRQAKEAHTEASNRLQQAFTLPGLDAVGVALSDGEKKVLETLTAKSDELQAKVDEYANFIKNIESIQEKNLEIERQRTGLAQAQERAARSQKAYDACLAKLFEVCGLHDLDEAAIARARAYQRACEECARLEVDKSSASSVMLATASAKMKAQQVYDSLPTPDRTAVQLELEPLKSKLAELNMRKSLLETLAQKMESTAQITSCPICKSAVSKDLGFDKEAIEALQWEIAPIAQTIRDKEGELISVERNKQDAKNKLENAETRREEAAQKYSEVSDALKAKKDAIGDAPVRNWNGASTVTEMENLQKHCAAAKTELGHARTAAEVLNFPLAGEEIKPVDVDAKQRTSGELDACRAQRQRVSNAYQQIRAAYEYIRMCQKSVEDKEKANVDKSAAAENCRQTCLQNTSLQPYATVEATDELFATVRQTLDDLQSRFDAAAGAVREAKASLDNVQLKQKDLEERMTKDKKTREVVERLRTLARAFQKDGLPAAILKHRFEQVVALTQNQLAEMDANFTVDAHETELFTFKFMRLDNDTGYWMHQKKLSGGQRVRLTVSFLLATHKLIIPQVGFLVLDEPGQGLDTTGKEHLKDLLMYLAEVMASAEAQCWISDHIPEIESAITSLVKL